MLFDCAVQQLQFFLQSGMTVPRQCLNKVFDHCAQSSGNLYVLRAAKPYLGECEMHKVLPIRRSKDHHQLAGFIDDLVGAQALVSGFP